jgi:hypothetical protein
VLEAALRPETRELTMIDPATGADKPLTVAWASALHPEPRLLRARPCGYWLAPEATDVVQRLERLGLTVQRLSAPQSLVVERYRVTAEGEGARTDTLGRVNDPQSVRRVAVALDPGRLEAPAGSYLVMLDQPLAHLATAALEPETAGSWFAQRLIGDLSLLARVLEPASKLPPPPAQ